MQWNVSVAAGRLQLSLRRAVRSRKRREKIIETAILLNHHDHVRDILRTAGGEKARDTAGALALVDGPHRTRQRLPRPAPKCSAAHLTSRPRHVVDAHHSRCTPVARSAAMSGAVATSFMRGCPARPRSNPACLSASPPEESSGPCPCGLSYAGLLRKEHRGTAQLVVLELLQRAVCLFQIHCDGVGANRNLAGDSQELLAVGASVRGDAANLAFVEESRS